MGSTGGQPASELVAGLLDTARASRARTMQEVAGARQRAGTITRNLILLASSETGSIGRPATDLVTQLHMYILVAGPEAATSRPQPPSPPGDGTPRAPGGWLAGLGHTITSGSGDDPVVTAWHRPGRPSGVRGRPGRCRTRHAASRRPGRGRYVAGDCCAVRKTRSPTGHPDTRPQRLAKAPSHMICPVNVSLSGRAIRTAAPGAGAKNPPSLRRSEVYPLVFRQYYRDPPAGAAAFAVTDGGPAASKVYPLHSFSMYWTEAPKDRVPEMGKGGREAARIAREDPRTPRRHRDLWLHAGSGFRLPAARRQLLRSDGRRPHPDRHAAETGAQGTSSCGRRPYAARICRSVSSRDR